MIQRRSPAVSAAAEKAARSRSSPAYLLQRFTRRACLAVIGPAPVEQHSVVRIGGEEQGGRLPQHLLPDAAGGGEDERGRIFSRRLFQRRPGQVGREQSLLQRIGQQFRIEEAERIVRRDDLQQHMGRNPGQEHGRSDGRIPRTICFFRQAVGIQTSLHLEKPYFAGGRKHPFLSVLRLVKFVNVDFSVRQDSETDRLDFPVRLAFELP